MTRFHLGRYATLGPVVVAASLAAVSCSGAPSSASSGPPPPRPAAVTPDPGTPAARTPVRGQRGGRPGAADGVVGAGVTVFDDATPAVNRLDPALLRALRAAAARAAAQGITVHVNSGWRSPAYQDQLLREAVARYGSARAAARWVATAATSPHVSGEAVDLGPADAVAWLAEHGSRYGLCQIYRNEPWHYELRPRAVTQGCPRPYADPTQDPRMQR